MKYEEIKSLKTSDIMQYLLKDVEVEDFKNVTSKSTIDRLKKDCNVIQAKMFEALKNENMGTYNNLQKALVNNINAIKSLEEDYKTVYSEYEVEDKSSEGKHNKQVAIWEQNSDGEIRNKKSWNIEDVGGIVNGNIALRDPNNDKSYIELKKLIADTVREVCKEQFTKN